MPRPLFIICADSGSVDRYSNSVSLFTIIESVQMCALSEMDEALDGKEPASLPSPVFKMRLVATWIGDEIDLGQKFQHESRLQAPGLATKVVASSEFVWKTRNYRFIVDISTGFKGAQSGTLFVVNAIRKKDDLTWLTQTYEIQFDVGDDAVAAIANQQSTPQE